MSRCRLPLVIATAVVAITVPAGAQAIRGNAAFNANAVARNDDGSSDVQTLGFTINFFGKSRSSVWVNNNGNLTFDGPLATFTPFGLAGTAHEIIAPYFADVDTRGPRSALVTFGWDTVNGHKAFGANYINVGYYQSHDDKLSSFQVVVIDREETGAGNFDIEFNYGTITWETGDASGGVGGFGGTPAAVGWSNGTADPDASYQYIGSLISGSFLDGGPHALIRAHVNTSVVGRMLFHARDGVLSPGLSITSGFPDATVGQPYNHTATAGGAAGPFTWTLTPDLTAIPGLTFTSAGVLSGTPTTAGVYTFTLGVTATSDPDSGPQTVYQRGSLTVSTPKVSIATPTQSTQLTNGTVGQPYSASLTGRGSTSGYTWTVANPYQLPPGIGLTSSGVLGGTPLAAGTYIFTVQAASNANDGSQSAQETLKLTVGMAAVQLTSGCTLQHATVGVPYTQLFQASGGTGLYRYQVAGQLPPGLAMSPDGQISGMPTYASWYPFTLNVTDSQNNTVSQQCGISVDAAQYTIAGCPLPSAITGTPYTARLSASGGSAPVLWSISGTLPSGLTLSPDGTISGTPMSAGPFLFRALAADGSGRQSSQPCSLVVTRGPLGVSGCPLPGGTVGQAYQTTLNGAGGFGPYLWTSAGSLPPGLSLSASGAVSGTPTASGAFPFTVQVWDSTQHLATQSCSMSVTAPQLALATACPLQQAKVGQNYSAQFAASGGTPPYTFDFYGFLPPGISASSSGVISGVPTRVGALPFGVQVTDSSNQTASGICSLAVALPSPPSLQLTKLPATVAPASSLQIGVQLNQAYSLPIQGQLVLNVAPNTSSSEGDANQPDPRLRFLNGQLTTSFTIPAGQTSVAVPLPTTGTVASTVTVSAQNLRAGGSALPVYPTPQIFSIAQAAPSITSACYTPNSTGVDLTMTGLSNTRELKSAHVVIGSSTFNTEVSGIASDYFTGPLSYRFGGAFTIDIPYTMQYPSANPGTVTVSLYNTIGQSGVATAQRCQ